MTCKLSLLDADGQTVQYMEDEYWYDDPQDGSSWCFPLVPVKNVLDYEKLYLVSGPLLRWEITVSTGSSYSSVDSIKYGVTEEHMACKTADASLPESLKNNLQQVFREGKFSDLTIRTVCSTFPVHKAILCARSEVFNAMFEHDTKENRTGVVEIEDLNDDTIAMMLLFTYTDILEDLDWEKALELFFAADKYEMVALKRECSSFLKDNMNSSNVCDVLALADMHQDKDMQSASQDFFMHNATEIIQTDNWETFLLENAYLAAKLQELLCI